MAKVAPHKEKMKAHIGKMEAQLNRWGAKLEVLAEQVDEAGSGAAAGYRGRVDELILKHKAVRQKLEEWRAAGIGGFEKFKTGVESSWRELESATKKLTARFKGAPSAE